MTDQELDKQSILEVQSREQTSAAFFLLLAYVETYGVESIRGDRELLTVLTRYDFLSRLYVALEECPGPHPPELAVTRLPLVMPAEWADHKRVYALISKERWDELCAELASTPPNHHMKRFSYPGEYTVCVNEPNELFAAFKFSPNEPRKTVIRLDAYVNTNIEAFVKIMGEVDMTKTWVPYFRFPIRVGLQACYTMGSYGRLDKVSMYKVDLPWPLTNREAILHGWMNDEFDGSDRMVISFTALDADYPLHPLLVPMESPEVGPKALRMYVEGGCRIRSLGPQRLLLEMMWNLDLKVDIPLSLLKFVVKTFIRTGMRSLQNVCRLAEVDAEWTALARANPWLYEYVRERAKVVTPSDVGLSSTPQDKKSGHDKKRRIFSRNKERDRTSAR